MEEVKTFSYDNIMNNYKLLMTFVNRTYYNFSIGQCFLIEKNFFPINYVKNNTLINLWSVFFSLKRNYLKYKKI